jgi:hypothetical protein
MAPRTTELILNERSRRGRLVTSTLERIRKDLRDCCLSDMALPPMPLLVGRGVQLAHLRWPQLLFRQILISASHRAGSLAGRILRAEIATCGVISSREAEPHQHAYRPLPPQSDCR